MFLTPINGLRNKLKSHNYKHLVPTARKPAGSTIQLTQPTFVWFISGPYHLIPKQLEPKA